MKLRQTDVQRSLGYGARILFVQRPLQLLDDLSERTRAYIRAYHALEPHRIVAPGFFTFDQIMGEPLFHNVQILDVTTGRPLHHEGFPLCMYTRITLLHYLRGLAQQNREFEGHLASELQAIVAALPPA